ncbi:ras-related and estrogen-regulated growth inhibitor-like isoform X2 [Anneissia japonica]|uniref:ras-related and estrogen-regulated growth inhibitor-like isoform X2 n=1 Tax=Anneissia japonica TaxID=1529436 RepID=UPI001425793E|nr:ras-related and estrogen-regulated growth inhibitor-like isoform X2 [Anneissia japonica]
MRSNGRHTTSLCSLPQRPRTIGSVRGYKSIITRNRPYHILVVGDSGVGKSALTVRFITKRFLTEYAPKEEITVEKYIDIDSCRMHVAITDSAKTVDVIPSDTSHIDGIMVVYDISKRPSFVAAIDILDSISQDAIASRIPKCLIGNKADLEHLRQVSTIEGEIVTAQYVTLDCMFHETSAENGVDSVNKAFQTLLRQV